jgi:NAD(P)-dependent dehydrogenase (short-subunit alcohol dehydrogenase family)
VSSGDTKNLFRLEDKVAIITGAAGLLGLQHALALSDFGATIVLTDIDQELCEQRASDIQSQSGIKAVAIQSDVREQSSWRSLLEQTLSRFGRVDILVNNAAFTTQSRSANYNASFSDFPLDDWKQILNVNLTGAYLGCQIVGSEMARRKGGSIINMASLYGVVSPHHRMYSGTEIQQPAAYSVSKAGVIALTRYLGTLWAENGVRVNCITPGGVHNEHSEDFTSRYAALSPIGRMADREEMRGALVYLASAASVYCTGHNLVVDGGWTVW